MGVVVTAEPPLLPSRPGAHNFFSGDFSSLRESVTLKESLIVQKHINTVFCQSENQQTYLESLPEGESTGRLKTLRELLMNKK